MNVISWPKLGPGDVKSTLLQALKSGLGAPLIVIAILGMMIVPVPAIILDMAFTFNIALSLIIILVVIYVMRPLDFASFPTSVLTATLPRAIYLQLPPPKYRVDSLARTHTVGLLQCHTRSDCYSVSHRRLTFRRVPPMRPPSSAPAPLGREWAAC